MVLGVGENGIKVVLSGYGYDGFYLSTSVPFGENGSCFLVNSAEGGVKGGKSDHGFGLFEDAGGRCCFGLFVYRRGAGLLGLWGFGFGVDFGCSCGYDGGMETRVIEVDLLDDCRAVYKEAAAVLAEGGLVALPTETVYGLGADAFCTEAVANVFAVKERPSFDPLICHLPNARALRDIAEVPAELQSLVDTLAREFWPGPMTLVLPRKECVPDIVTSGLPTVACRVPSHEVMRGVARALGHPIAAPSANRFGHISPTSAGAVLKELGGRIPLVLDAGACSEGLESTILLPCLDEKGRPAVRVLREGPLTREKLRGVCRVLRNKSAKSSAGGAAEDGGAEGVSDARPQAPGQLKSHYAPSKPLLLCDPRGVFVPEPGLRYGLITYQGDSPLAGQDCWVQVMPLSPGSGRLSEAAVRLFAVMRAMDECADVDVIVAEELPVQGLGAAMMDRLSRAAAKRGEVLS